MSGLGPHNTRLVGEASSESIRSDVESVKGQQILWNLYEELEFLEEVLEENKTGTRIDSFGLTRAYMEAQQDYLSEQIDLIEDCLKQRKINNSKPMPVAGGVPAIPGVNC